MKSLLILFFTLLLNINFVRATDLNDIHDIANPKPKGVASSLALKSSTKKPSKKEIYRFIQARYSSQPKLWSISLPEAPLFPRDCCYSLTMGPRLLGGDASRVVRTADGGLITLARHISGAYPVFKLHDGIISIKLNGAMLHPTRKIVSKNRRMMSKFLLQQSLLNPLILSSSKQMNRRNWESKGKPVAVLQLLSHGGKTLTLYYHEFKSPEQVIQELVFKKTVYFGEKLNNEIQEISEGESFQQLTTIKEHLVEVPQNLRLKKKKKVRNEVTVFVKKEDDDRDDMEGFKRSLLGAAYFPEELDPRTKSISLVSLAHFKFIHRQLADALFYGHPLASQYLKEIISICNAPLEDENSYQNFYHIPDIDLGNYKQYSVPIKAHSATIEVIEEGEQEEDINQEIDLPSYSQEMGDYFSDLIKQNPEERRKKLKEL